MKNKNLIFNSFWDKLSSREKKLILTFTILLWAFILLKLIVIPAKSIALEQKLKIQDRQSAIKSYEIWIDKEEILKAQNDELKEEYQRTFGIIDRPISGKDIDYYLNNFDFGLVIEQQYQQVEDIIVNDNHYYKLPLYMKLKIPKKNLTLFEFEWLKTFPNSRITELTIENAHDDWVYANINLSNYTTIAPPKQGFINRYKHNALNDDLQFELELSDVEEENIIISKGNEKENTEQFSYSHVSPMEEVKSKQVLNLSNISALNGKVYNIGFQNNYVSFDYLPNSKKIDEIIFIKPADTITLNEDDHISISLSDDMLPGELVYKIQELDGNVKDIKGTCNENAFILSANKEIKIIGIMYCLETNHLSEGSYEIFEN